MLETFIDREAGVTTVHCTGKVTATEISNWLLEYYGGEPTRHVLWDGSDADGSELETSDVERFIQIIRSIMHSRDQGRTAIVASRRVSKPGSIAIALARLFRNRLEPTSATSDSAT